MARRLGLTRRALIAAVPAVGFTSRPVASAQTCTRVELYPGYPGYRGIVTGLSGPGDTACLESLEAAGFSAADEDRQNAEAAHRLGIAGPKELWTWENWMAIEAERGVLPTCLMCLDLVGTQRERRTNRVVVGDDPRILSGSWSTGNRALLWAASELGWDTWPGNLAVVVPDDISLRAIIGLANPGRHLNAGEYLQLYPRLVEDLAAGALIDSDLLWDTLYAQGGHAPVPPSTHPDDQILMWETGSAPLLRLIPELLGQASRSMMQSQIISWRSQGSSESLAEYMSRVAGRS